MTRLIAIIALLATGWSPFATVHCAAVSVAAVSVAAVSVAAPGSEERTDRHHGHHGHGVADTDPGAAGSAAADTPTEPGQDCPMGPVCASPAVRATQVLLQTSAITGTEPRPRATSALSASPHPRDPPPPRLPV
jgi:hypothetical protein